MTTTSTPDRTPALGPTGTFVEARIKPLQYGYLQDHPDAVRTLAQLRRGAGRLAHEVPELWGVAFDDGLYTRGLSGEEETGYAENAAHAALTLYATHQQSRRDTRMHLPGRGLGGAVRRLMPPGDIDEPLRRRFVQAGSATTMSTRLYRLREIVTLLRRESVPLDYALLADQLHRAQRPGGMAKVRAEWGRGFHAHRTRTAPGTEPAPTTDTTTDKDDQ
ncbi:type I-E CRISPR-associated protein Cse2/CasB [Nocardiopsis ansamitocini]|uniref:Type I-E CRISPR-associated protein Cse2/CasB n=1 Tax=Nocardiopsis ansamitocini TaxID=1670832 RepID=A0A9W6ULC2_9ACTN|nr:type I-E CRISPR-associated protein Cse2/CasB [Nocardiopsis ansamitocini]GLU49940.1 hypothetical protein Nans01_42910 [Nocardiopsis ansamitocini]